jgi:hypothetical protein
MLVAMFLVSWTPYSVVTLIGQFGPPGVVTPFVAALPAYFAKVNSLLYILSKLLFIGFLIKERMLGVALDGTHSQLNGIRGVTT